MEKPALSKMNLSGVRVIMTIMHVPVEELLCQAVTGRSSAHHQMCLGSYGYVLSCQALNCTASQGPGPIGAQPVLENP
jgi:hypothetical protein